jgi:hypothetical protein
MIMNQILARNPEARQLYESLKCKSPDELRQYAENVAKGKGVDLPNFLGQYGFRY